MSLFCHSLGLGPFGNLEKPPYEASQADLNRSALSFGHMPSVSDMRLVRAYNQRDLDIVTPGERDAFETMGIITNGTFGPMADPKLKKSELRLDYKKLQEMPYYKRADVVTAVRHSMPTANNQPGSLAEFTVVFE